MHRMKHHLRFRSHKWTIESTVRQRWFLILAVAQIALFFYLYHINADAGRPMSFASSGQVDDKFAYLRPAWSTIQDFLYHCAEFDSSTQNATDTKLGPLTAIFKDQEYDIFEMADILNKYEVFKSSSQHKKTQRGNLAMQSTCLPWAHVESPMRPPRIAMMTLATYSKNFTPSHEGAGEMLTPEQAEEERRIHQEAQTLSLSDKEEYCRQHGYDFYAVTDAFPGRAVPWSKIPAAMTLLPKYDWLVWVDADAIIVDHSVRLEEFTDPRYDAIVGLDENGLNTGVFFMQSSVWSQLYLAEAWTLTEEPMSYIWWEQSAIMRLTKADGIRNHVKLSPQSQFNEYFRNNELSDGRFIVHFAGIIPGGKWRTVLEYHGLRKNVRPR